MVGFFFICDPELYSAVILTFNSGLIIVLKYLLTSRTTTTFYSPLHAVWLPIDEMVFMLDSIPVSVSGKLMCLARTEAHQNEG